VFDDAAVAPDGLAEVGVKPKRKDVLLVEGAIFVQPSDGELSRIEGKLSKTPSFWTRRVDVVRRYERQGGVRVPVAIESVAHVLIAGRSTFKMTYEYQTINGQHVGDPQPHAQASPLPTETLQPQGTRDWGWIPGWHFRLAKGRQHEAHRSVRHPRVGVRRRA